MRIEELHWSLLRVIAKSPAHLLAAAEAGRDHGKTKARGFGSLVHAVVLGGKYIAWEDRDPETGKVRQRRGKEWDAFKAEHGEDAWIVPRSEVTRAQLVGEKLRSHPVAGPLLRGKTEMPWTATMHGRLCGGTVDIYDEVTGFLPDLKTAATTQPDRFLKACRFYGYHAQLAWYRDGLRALGHKVNACKIIGVETVKPYAVTVFHVSEGALLEGEKLNRLWLEQLATCEAADEWPEYAQCELSFDVEDEEQELIFGDEDESGDAESDEAAA